MGDDDDIALVATVVQGPIKQLIEIQKVMVACKPSLNDNHLYRNGGLSQLLYGAGSAIASYTLYRAARHSKTTFPNCTMYIISGQGSNNALQYFID